MRERRTSLILAAFAACVANLALPGPGSADTKQECLTSQLSYSGSICRGMARCYTRPMRRGTAVDSECIPGLRAKQGSQFFGAESEADCLTEPGADSVSDMQEPVLDNSANSLGLSGGKCAAKKMGALGRECKQLLRCYAAAVADNPSIVDTNCLDSAQSTLVSLFNRYEVVYTCDTNGDGSTLSSDFADLADDIYSYLRGSGTTTTTTSTTSTSTTTLLTGSCPQDGSFTPCIAYRDNGACKTCVDATVGPDAGVASSLCAAAGDSTCDDASENEACGYAINTSTTCSDTCCPWSPAERARHAHRPSSGMRRQASG